MANLHRLIFFVVLVVSCSASWSALVSQSGYKMQSQWVVGQWLTGVTYQAVCQSGAVQYNQYGGPKTYTVSVSTASTCTVLRNDGALSYNDVYPASVCPANSSGETNCVCNSGFTESGGVCVPPLVCVLPQLINASGTACYTPATNDSRCVDQAALASMAFGQSRIVVKGTGAGLCVETAGNSPGVGCNVVLQDVISYKYADGTIYTDGFPHYVQGSGQTCAVPSVATPEAPIKISEAVKSCKGGQQGQVNGVTVCIPYPSGTTATTSLKQTTVGPNGVTGLPEVKTSVSSNVCLNGSCTSSTTTTTNTGGVTTIVNNEPVTVGGSNSTSLDSKTTAKSEYCTLHPKDSQCGQLGDGGSNFSGVCGQPPACEGDAVMCAIAAATFQTNCALNPPASQESGLYDTSKVLTGNQTTNLPGNSTVNFSSASFDQTEFLGAAAGLADVVVVVMGRTITLPFSNINIWLSRLGLMFQAVTFLLCIRIVSRG